MLTVCAPAFAYEQSSLCGSSENAAAPPDAAFRESDPIAPSRQKLSGRQITSHDASDLSASVNKIISVDFKAAGIHDVLRMLSAKSGVNIVAAKDVEGDVTLKLTDVPWNTALDVILSTHDLGYEKKGEIIAVSTVSRLTEQKEAEKKLAEMLPVVTEVITLKYLDAADVKDTLQPQLSSQGRITVLSSSAQAGWEFLGGAEQMRKLERQELGEKSKQSRSKKLIISDISPYLEKFKNIIKELDIPPKQVLIEARIMEVNEDTLRDIGIDWGTGSSGAEGSTIASVGVEKNLEGNVTQAVGGHSLGDQVTPSVFGPETSAMTTANSGLKLLYQRLRGTQFEVILHALEEDVDTNTLSAPRILALNNQEATILVGTKYPILKSETEEGVVTTTLDYYQDIGIQLNVAPQVCADDAINMIIHPAITSSDTTIGTNQYPVITTREAETSVMMKSGDTVAIGGLLKDIKKRGVIGIPFLKDIPFIGEFFKRRTSDTEKIDLLIFISARVISGDNITGPDRAALEAWDTAQKIEADMIRRKARLKKNEKRLPKKSQRNSRNRKRK